MLPRLMSATTDLNGSMKAARSLEVRPKASRSSLSILPLMTELAASRPSETGLVG